MDILGILEFCRNMRMAIRSKAPGIERITTATRDNLGNGHCVTQATPASIVVLVSDFRPILPCLTATGSPSTLPSTTRSPPPCCQPYHRRLSTLLSMNSRVLNLHSRPVHSFRGVGPSVANNTSSRGPSSTPTICDAGVGKSHQVPPACLPTQPILFSLLL